jgi:hypothetical protein
MVGQADSSDRLDEILGLGLWLRLKKSRARPGRVGSILRASPVRFAPKQSAEDGEFRGEGTAQGVRPIVERIGFKLLLRRAHCAEEHDAQSLELSQSSERDAIGFIHRGAK